MKGRGGHPDDRLNRIEIALETSIHEYDLRFQKLTEMQADTWRAIDTLAGSHQDLAGVQKSLAANQNELAAHQNRLAAHQNELAVSHNEFAASRKELIAMQKDLTVTIKEIGEAQQATDEKLNILIDTIDRMIRRRNGNT